MRTPSARLTALLAVTLIGASRVTAAPRDELLRVAPPDAALVVVAQNARGHLKDLSESPFASWFPTTRIGAQLLASANFRKAKEGTAEVFRQLGTTPDELLDDVFGDALVFAFSRGSSDNKAADRSVILVRPRRPETLQKVIDKLNDLQKKSGELKEVVSREHNGAGYFERQRTAEPSEFYFLRDGVFAFSESEADIRAVIDRQRGGDKAPELAERLKRSGVDEAAVILLVNPRAFDADIRAKVAAANRDEKAFLTTFEQAWTALDAVAVYLDHGSDLETGAVLRFRPDAVPAGVKAWLLGPRTPSGLWAAVPENALVAVAGRVKMSELIETLGALVADDGKNGVRAGVDQIVGPAIGRDKLAAVLDGLGPDWALWAAPPAPGTDNGFLPVVVAALQVRTEGPAGADAAKSLEQAVEFGFRMARFAYNSGHADQIDWRETPDRGAVIRSLVNEKAFPAGFRPSFALKDGFLLLATSPDAIKSFRPPAATPKPGGDVPLVRFSGTAARAYLHDHRAALARALTDAGAGPEQEVLTHLDQFAAVLELFDRVELLTRGDPDGCRLTLRVTFAKPLKK
jgi:hypothetical protein